MGPRQWAMQCNGLTGGVEVKAMAPSAVAWPESAGRHGFSDNIKSLQSNCGLLTTCDASPSLPDHFVLGRPQCPLLVCGEGLLVIPGKINLTKWLGLASI